MYTHFNVFCQKVMIGIFLLLSIVFDCFVFVLYGRVFNIPYSLSISLSCYSILT